MRDDRSDIAEAIARGLLLWPCLSDGTVSLANGVLRFDPSLAPAERAALFAAVFEDLDALRCAV